jgi:hypothetical protein
VDRPHRRDLPTFFGKWNTVLIVCTQSTKRLALTLESGREGVSYFDFAIGDDDAVNEEFEQRPLALEVRGLQSLADTPAESIRVGGKARGLVSAVNVTQEILLLPLQG